MMRWHTPSSIIMLHAAGSIIGTGGRVVRQYVVSSTSSSSSSFSSSLHVGGGVAGLNSNDGVGDSGVDGDGVGIDDVFIWDCK